MELFTVSIHPFLSAKLQITQNALKSCFFSIKLGLGQGLGLGAAFSAADLCLKTLKTFYFWDRESVLRFWSWLIDLNKFWFFWNLRLQVLKLRCWRALIWLKFGAPFRNTFLLFLWLFWGCGSLFIVEFSNVCFGRCFRFHKFCSFSVLRSQYFLSQPINGKEALTSAVEIVFIEPRPFVSYSHIPRVSYVL